MELSLHSIGPLLRLQVLPSKRRSLTWGHRADPRLEATPLSWCGAGVSGRVSRQLEPYSHPPSTQVPPGLSGPHRAFQCYLWSLEERFKLDAALLSAQKLLCPSFMATPGLVEAWEWQGPGEAGPAAVAAAIKDTAGTRVRGHCRRGIAHERFWNAKELFQTMNIKEKKKKQAKGKTGFSPYSL